MKRSLVTKYIIELFDEEHSSFKFSSQSNLTLLSTDFAISALFALDQIDTIASIKKKVEINILNQVNPSGYIVDKHFNQNINHSFHKNDYILPQFTYFSLIALDILGIHLDNLPFLDKFLDKNFLNKWFHNLNWGNFWYESNKIMFLLYFLFYLNKYGKTNKCLLTEVAINQCFSVLNAMQDPSTGLWGTNFNNKNITDGVYGSAHIFLFYDYYNQPINYCEQAIDSTLSVHASNGLAQTKEGGACEDYDLIEIYLRLLSQTDYRKPEILSNLKKMYSTITRSQLKDGGFSYKIYHPKNIYYKIVSKAPANLTYKYSSWDRMTTSIYYSDIWATFFRLLSLNAIDCIMKKKRVPSYWLPGWGYVFK